jgi:hypothetical protein
MRSGEYVIVLAVSLFIAVLSPTSGAGAGGGDGGDGKYAIQISGSWNSLKNGKLNGDYIEAWRSWGYLDDKINSGFGITPEIIYFLSPKISVAAGLVYIGGSTEKSQTVIDSVNDDTTEVRDYVKTSIYAPAFSLRFHARREEFDFSLGFSELLLFGRASRRHAWIPLLRTGPIENDYHSSGFGFQIFGELHYRLNNKLFYTMNIGYRKMDTGDLVDNDSEMPLLSIYSIEPEPINLEYSGPYISAGLMIRLF